MNRSAKMLVIAENFLRRTHAVADAGRRLPGEAGGATRLSTRLCSRCQRFAFRRRSAFEIMCRKTTSRRCGTINGSIIILFNLYHTFIYDISPVQCMPFERPALRANRLTCGAYETADARGGLGQIRQVS